MLSGRSRKACPKVYGSAADRILSPADLDHAYERGEMNKLQQKAKDFFAHNRQFWDMILSKAQRPILGQVFRRLGDRLDPV
jgi:hypothetical protein